MICSQQLIEFVEIVCEQRQKHYLLPLKLHVRRSGIALLLSTVANDAILSRAFASVCPFFSHIFLKANPNEVSLV